MTSLSSVIGIADGDRETTYLFRCNEGEFIVTLFESGAEPLDLERAFQTMQVLHDHGVPCPKPLRTTDGQATVHAAGRLVAAVSFVPGALIREATAGKCESLGRVMAQIHTILERKGRSNTAGLPTGAVHGALSHENVFFLGDSVSGIINFRLRHDDALIAEVADVLVTWTGLPSGNLHGKHAQALVKGYQAIRTLTAIEAFALPGFVLASTARRYANHEDRSALPAVAAMAYASAISELII